MHTSFYTSNVTNRGYIQHAYKQLQYFQCNTGAVWNTFKDDEVEIKFTTLKLFSISKYDFQNRYKSVAAWMIRDQENSC